MRTCLEHLVAAIESAVRQDDKTRQDKTRQDKTRQDKTRQGKTRQDKTRQDKTKDEDTTQTQIPTQSKANTNT